MQAWKIPGVAVCIVKDGKVIHQKGYGLTQLGNDEKVSEQTLFPIASVSKQFIGAALATLEAQGKVSLDDKLEKWLPEFEMKDKDYQRQIILADLLSHRSGWKTFQGDLLNTESSMDVPAMLQKFGQITPAYPIRTRFGYSNFGYLLAGETIKPIYGKDWRYFLQATIFDPLNMRRTLIHADAINKASDIVSDHTLKKNQVVVLPAGKPDPQPQ
ncbi:beta-lactamase [Flammeovirgaceae bacterium 311]|nr:beta-lactamase [Flammeovirgaceae bacterium 311]